MPGFLFLFGSGNAFIHVPQGGFSVKGPAGFRDWFYNGGGRLLVSSEQRLFLWWRLDEGSGVTALDGSFYDHKGTLVNMEASDWTTPAPLVNFSNAFALDFDGQNEYVTTDLTDLTDVQEFSLCVWVRVGELPMAVPASEFML